MQTTLLGGLTATQFLRRHWQKQARLIRQALPDFAGILSRKELYALAARDDVESRLVIRRAGRGRAGWSLERGPFRAADFRGLPASGWTLLVQGVDLHVDAAADLIAGFNFVPYARLDDLMISYAVPEGGVGPHFDSYDVFLLQGPGRRRWRTSTQRDLELTPGVPLKILRRFRPENDWILEPGDMLYVPPDVAHDGIAVTECMTYSIGFRAPAADELVEQFLQFLPDALGKPAVRYADPDLPATRSPGRIDLRLQRRLGSMLKTIRWDRAMVDRFIGCVLSEPKPTVFLDPPENPLRRSEFAARIARSGTGGVRLDRRARMLYDSMNVYLDGAVVAPVAEHPLLATLADRRRLPPDSRWTKAVLDTLFDAYLCGALHVGEKT
ncbi:MAG: cupin domain-containing protein [Betaproteobacteria bacterium]